MNLVFMTCRVMYGSGVAIVLTILIVFVEVVAGVMILKDVEFQVEIIVHLIIDIAV